jgi:TonB family protein
MPLQPTVTRLPFGAARRAGSRQRLNAGVRRDILGLLLLLTLSCGTIGCTHRRTVDVMVCGGHTGGGLLVGEVTLQSVTFVDAGLLPKESWAHLEPPLPRFVYPPLAIRMRVQGVVELEGVLAPDGTVERVAVVRSRWSGLDEAALRGIANLHVRRFQDGGQIASRRFRATVLFVLH